MSGDKRRQRSVKQRREVDVQVGKLEGEVKYKGDVVSAEKALCECVVQLR